ncbi:MAG TPA: ubiquinol oxidase subunit II [Dongiaceae bacterium]|nr:ubiquinol oxidase subunit II [Dongiaceae bacterium]
MRHDKKRIRRRVAQVLISGLVTLAIIGVLVFVTQGRDVPVLNPHGTIAHQEQVLILITVGLGVFVVVPVFILLFVIAWRYRASNTKAKYEPDMHGRRGLELLWWGIPCAIILALAIITTIATHVLDPYKPLQSNVTPVKVQVVAMQWKWLFIYPDYNIATLNYVNIPKNTPIDFSITSDAPMNSFWVPALAGQIYAMSGMSTQLHVMADSVGTYNGVSANISGEGFADMHFKVYSMTEGDFTTWTKKASYSQNMLTSDAYNKIAAPSKNDPETTYLLMDNTLYDDVIMKYMMPSDSNGSHSGTAEGTPNTTMDMSGMKM